MRKLLASACVTAFVLAGCTPGEPAETESQEATTGESGGEASDLDRVSSEICEDALAEEDKVAASSLVRREVTGRAPMSSLSSVDLREAVDDECGDAIDDLPDLEPSYYEPGEDDFELTLNVLEQECFGSAGCNVTVRVEVGFSFVGELDPDTTYEVTYEILGGEDPKINTLTIEGDEYSVEDGERISTESGDAELTAEVLRVNPR